MNANTSPATALRGRVLTFKGIEDGVPAYDYHRDGMVVVRNGKVDYCGEYDPRREVGVTIDHRPHLIMPGFIDAHIHMPQMRIVGAYAPSLLEWLNEFTFTEEQLFKDPSHSARIAGAFFDELLRNGTTTAAAYCSVHATSVDALFSEASRRNMLMLTGKTMMDRNAPEGLRDTPETGYRESKALIERWHGKGRNHYVITPRFAITSTPEQLDMTAALRREFPDLHVQTHVDESVNEIALARQLYPEAPDYLGIYESYGLLGEKTLLGHCIHLTDREVEVISGTGSVAVWCPTSNLFLGSGLFDNDRLAEAGVNVALATDVGAGTSFSMLRTMDEAYKISQLQSQRLDPLRSFYAMTLGNARCLGLSDRIGRIDVGMDADLVVLDAWSTPQMSFRMETVTDLAGELFLLQTSGDDRSVVQTYVMGQPMKVGSAAMPTWRPSRAAGRY